ncbi:SulP family inorganic anion transporter [Actinoallomurus sp. NBC_01490]|uniref:SulP family inorganic anion transporter n=1 Tax=Actinoallomurus sp. NBC_01490 TaxID=2903557 RepID=UPI002E345954|nr:SulP family inorganic anion transporter [Actinoallomurus sp. NBC_01490]
MREVMLSSRRATAARRGRRRPALRDRLTALLPGRADWAAMRRDPRRDVLAGLSVAVVALPLALAYGASSGLGARAGLATAVIAGTLAAIFGGGALQVSGPTGVMTVVLVPIIRHHGVEGALLAGMMAGVLLILAALARLGRYARCVPASVVEGFAVGVAIVIALQQVPAALGLDARHGEKVWRAAVASVADYLKDVRPAPLLMAAAVAAAMMVGSRRLPKLPVALIAIATATLAARFLPLHLELIGDVPSGLPSPSLHFLHLGVAVTLLPSALAIAVLAALEGLLSAAVVDALGAGERSDPDRELFGQGLANLAVPLVGGVPATATLARTAVNVRCGATSRLASLTHALALAVIAFAAGGLVSAIPRAALAGLMLGAAARMIKIRSLTTIVRTSAGDALIVTFTLIVTVMVNLIAAVAAGVVIATVVTVAALARSGRIEAMPLEPHCADGNGAGGNGAGGNGAGGDGADLGGADGNGAGHERAGVGDIGLYRLEGPWFFAATHRLLQGLGQVNGRRVVILSMADVSALDLTAARVLGETITQLRSRGVTVLLAGVRPRHHRLISQATDGGRPPADLVHPDPAAALVHARSLIGTADPHHERRA